MHSYFLKEEEVTKNFMRINWSLRIYFSFFEVLYSGSLLFPGDGLLIYPFIDCKVVSTLYFGSSSLVMIFIESSFIDCRAVPVGTR